MKADQDFSVQIDSAVANYRRNPQRLHRLTRQLRHPDTRQLCRKCAEQLLELEPKSIEAISSLIFSYTGRKSRTQLLRTALDYAHQRAEGDPKLLDKILTNVHNKLNDEERSSLDVLLRNYTNEAKQISRRKAINLEAQKRLLKRTDIEPNSCDVISVASNEGPYIAEFIHHYIYQGFTNLFIGLNNDHSGATGPIVEAIRAHFPQVHLINTDPEHQQDQQRGSYTRLYEVASRTSTSSHCMVVDVDESWVAYPFSTTIREFLSAHSKADVISSNWLHCHGANLFDNCLDLSNTRLRLTDQFKSLFRYGIAVTDLGAHVPWVLGEPEILHTSSDGIKVNSTAVNALRRLRKRGIKASINTNNTSWVIHRHTRSELEYAYKLLHPDVNKQEIPFKPNRMGYLLPKESLESRQLASNLFGPSRQPPQAYRDSLQAFIERCGIHDLIRAARAEIGEDPINKRIKAMHPDDISNNRSIWTRTFRGTRFMKLLEQRGRTSAPSKKA
ncbi:glycosyltransferase family 2 protein [Synechococcus sp. AH-736-M02]|nr:glycosyltransferase family 2 protein [Synechococcus sp. AH-736-M02]